MCDEDHSTVEVNGNDAATQDGRMEYRLAHAIAAEIGLLTAQFQNQFITPRKYLMEVEVRCSNMRAITQNLDVRHALARAETMILRATVADCAWLLAETTEALKATVERRTGGAAGGNGEGASC